jgi:protein-histidine pros-kinase
VKLSFKFAVAVGLLLAATLGGTAWMIIQHQQEVITRQAHRRAQMVLSFGEACRAYARNKLSPAVSRVTKQMVFEANFATFVARGTFAELRHLLPGYSFREASLNPLNPKNRADAEEEKLIRQFQTQPGLKELSGFRRQGDDDEFFVARPIVVQKVCLQCHDRPTRAPAELVRRYGNQSGFGWREGDVLSALMITVPAQDIHEEQAAMRWKVFGMFGLLTTVLIVFIYVLFERLVHRRLRLSSAVMGQVAAQPTAAARIPDEARDEIGTMATAFNHMADSLRDSHLSLEQRVAERTAELAAANAQLQQEMRDRQRAEAILRASEERFKAFMNNSPTVAFMKEEDGRIVHINRPCERRFQVKLADWQGKTEFDLWPPPLCGSGRKGPAGTSRSLP